MILPKYRDRLLIHLADVAGGWLANLRRTQYGLRPHSGTETSGEFIELRRVFRAEDSPLFEGCLAGLIAVQASV